MSVGDAQPRSGDASTADEMGGCLSATELTVAGWRRTPGGRADARDETDDSFAKWRIPPQQCGGILHALTLVVIRGQV